MARGIRANLVVPSLVDTPLGREASRLNPGRTARNLPFGRQATAWEVAYATVWLLSGESSYVNAHPLILDGGATSFGLPPWRCAADLFPALPFHWQFGQTAGHPTGTHPKLLERDCEPHRGKARQQLGEDRLQFDPGERGAEAVVGAVPEREMGRPFAGDVEAIGAGKDRGIVVGGARVQQHQVARVHG